MPRLRTTCFGEIDYPEAAVFHFPSGLPGFEAEHDFVFLERTDTNPLIFMHSLSNPDLCFMLLPVLAADPKYRLNLSTDDRTELQLKPDGEPRIGEDILCGALISAADGQQSPTVNLLSPIVVNLKIKIGIQAIQTHSGYSHRQPLFASEEVTCL